MYRATNRLLSLLNIEPGEGVLVGTVLAYAILLYASNVLASTASYALFLGEFDADNLPVVYVGISIVTPLISVIYLRLNQRIPLSTVLLIVHGFLLLTLAVIGLILTRAAPSWLVFSLPVYFGVNNSLTISSFWNLLGRIYNLQQGKRLFGLLSSGEHVATILVGFITPLLVFWLGTSRLFLVAAFLMMATSTVLILIIRKHIDKLEEVETQSSGENQTRSSSLLANPYVRLIVGLFALFIIGIYIVNNIFYSQVEQHYASEDEMAAFIGLFFGVFGVLSLFTQVFMAGRVLNRFGVRAMILATPVGLLIIMTLFSLIGAFTAWTAALFWLIVIANMYRSILDAIDSAAVNVMYQPLPANQRTQAQTFVIGIVYPISIGVTGLLLLLFTNLLDFTPVMLSFLLLIILVVWLWIGLRLGRAYPRQVQQAISQRIFQDGEDLRLDESGLIVVREGLTSPHVGVVLYALDTLTATIPESMGEILTDSLHHPLPAIRIEALQRIEQMRLTETLPAIRLLLHSETNPTVQANAIRTLATLDESSAIDMVSPYLTDADSQIRRGALVGLLHNSGNEIRTEAEIKLFGLVSSAEVADRILATQVIGEAAKPDLDSMLEPLLTDADGQVRRAAIEAAGHAGYPQLWGLVVAALTAPETQSVASVALVAGGEAAIPAIQTAFNQANPDDEQLVRIARICGRIRGEKATALLLSHLDNPNNTVRSQVIAALRQCGFCAEPDQQSAIEQQIHAEAEEAAKTIAILIDLEKDQVNNGHLLLLNALHNQLARLQENIFYLLSFIYDPQAILQAWEVLRPTAKKGVDQRAYALESMSIVVDKEFRTILFPLINNPPLPEQLARLATVFPQSSQTRAERLQTLLQSPTPWLQLCAIYEIGRLELFDDELIEELATLVLASRQSTELIDETAVWTLAQLPAEKVDQLLAASDYENGIALAQKVQTRRTGHDISMPTLAKVGILEQTNLFTTTDQETALNVAALMPEVDFVPGERIITKGDKGDGMFIIVSGRVRLHDGLYTFNFLEAGDVLGEMALLDRQPRSASATAVGTTHLLRLDSDPFYETLESYPSIIHGIIRVLSRKLRDAVSELTELQRQIEPAPGAAPADLAEVQASHSYHKLLPIESMMLLKRIDMFRRIPDNLLAQLALLLQEVILESGETVFEKGTVGKTMYIVVKGRMRVHDVDRTLNYLSEGDIFGEMALLDSETRSASVTAVEPSQLLRLDRAPFFELLDDHIEMAEGIIQILTGRLRDRSSDLTEMKRKIPG